jgi:hypothetical protein
MIPTPHRAVSRPRAQAFTTLLARPPRSLAGALVAAILACAGPAPATPIRSGDDQGRVTDWTTGQLLARGIGVADRHAPSPAVARDAARRRAIADATRALIAAAAQLPMANGQRLAKALDPAALAAVAATAQVSAAEPLVDGSWRVELALPLEALRLAVAGPRPAPAADDTGPSVLIVQLSGKMAPALGVGFGDGKVVRRGATLWVEDQTDGIPLSAQTLRQAATVQAKGASAGTIRVPRLADATDATLFVVVLGK